MNEFLVSKIAALNRRQFIAGGGVCLGAAALAELGAAADGNSPQAASHVLHHLAKAKRVIYLFMHGGPSQIELFDFKPRLKEWNGEELPASIRGDQRLTGMTSNQKTKPVVASKFPFARHGASGAWMSELLPHLSERADDLCILKGMHTEAINHDPAVTYLQTGHQQPGRPSLGSWLSYGLGSENQEMPAFVVLVSRGSAARPADPLHARLWGAEFLPSQHQGTQFRSDGDPVLFLSNPAGLSRESRRRTLDTLAALNNQHRAVTGDPETEARASRSMSGRFGCKRRCPNWSI